VSKTSSFALSPPRKVFPVKIALITGNTIKGCLDHDVDDSLPEFVRPNSLVGQGAGYVRFGDDDSFALAEIKLCELVDGACVGSPHLEHNIMATALRKTAWPNNDSVVPGNEPTLFASPHISPATISAYSANAASPPSIALNFTSGA
jgi:hypothetical protein